MRKTDTRLHWPPPARRTEPTAMKAAGSRKLNFLANVDPIDVSRALRRINPEETLVVVISKTFTTAETMLNARTVRSWLQQALGEPTAHLAALLNDSV